jgi:hypothetical protein
MALFPLFLSFWASNATLGLLIRFRLGVLCLGLRGFAEPLDACADAAAVRPLTCAFEQEVQRARYRPAADFERRGYGLASMSQQPEQTGSDSEGRQRRGCR